MKWDLGGNMMGIFSTLLSKSSIIFLITIGILSLSFYFYFNWSQQQIKILSENSAKLEQALDLSQKNFKSLQARIDEIIIKNSELQKKMNFIEKRNLELQNKLNIPNLNERSLAERKKTEELLNENHKKIIDELKGLSK